MKIYYTENLDNKSMHALEAHIVSFALIYRLTQRESEILYLIAAFGFTNKEIADRCVIAEKTVKIHISNMMKKIGIGSIRKLFALLYSHGLSRDKRAII